METALDATLDNIRNLIVADVNKLREDAERSAALAVSSQLDALTEHNNDLSAKLQAALSTIDGLERGTARKDAVVEQQRFSTTILLLQVNNQRVSRRIFTSWLLFQRTMKRRKMALSALSVSSCLQLARRAFWMWRVSSSAHARDREASQQRREVIAHTRQLEESATAERNALKSQILTLTNRLDSEVSTREKYREDLRAALLRGVCALNQEAFDVFSDHPKEGTTTIPQVDPPKAQLPSVPIKQRSVEVPRTTKGVVMNPDYPPRHT